MAEKADYSLALISHNASVMAQMSNRFHGCSYRILLVTDVTHNTPLCLTKRCECLGYYAE